MKEITARSIALLVVLLALSGLQGCFGLQRAWGCSDPGFFGCKDKVTESPEMEQPPAALKRAPGRGRVEAATSDDGRYLEGHEYPWSRLLDDCLATGQTRTECFAELPPDILELYEAWETENAAERHQH